MLATAATIGACGGDERRQTPTETHHPPAPPAEQTTPVAPDPKKVTPIEPAPEKSKKCSQSVKVNKHYTLEKACFPGVQTLTLFYNKKNGKPGNTVVDFQFFPPPDRKYHWPVVDPRHKFIKAIDITIDKAGRITKTGTTKMCDATPTSVKKVNKYITAEAFTCNYKTETQNPLDNTTITNLIAFFRNDRNGKPRGTPRDIISFGIFPPNRTGETYPVTMKSPHEGDITVETMLDERGKLHIKKQRAQPHSGHK